MARSLEDEIIAREARLRSDRSTAESIWQEISDFAMPDRGTFTVSLTEGIDRQRSLLDGTMARALEQFASFLHTTLNNPAAQWIEVQATNVPPHRAKSLEFQKALEETGKSIQSFLTGSNAKLYGALHTAYMDIGSIGNAVLHTQLRDNEFSATPRHMSSLVFEEDSWGSPSAVFATYKWTPDQVADRFGPEALLRDGENPSDEQQIRRRLEGGPVRIVHAVFPNSVDRYALAARVPEEVAQFGSFTSVWVNADTRKQLQIGPERTQPYVIGRWLRTSGPSPYARGPGHTALPDARMVNRMTSSLIRAAEVSVDTPFAVRDGSLISPLRLFPSGITYYDGDTPPTPLRQNPGGAILTQQMVEAKQGAIREAFFTPLFMSPDSPVRTATEILQQADERNRSISPMLVRIQDEFLTALVARGLDLAEQVNALPPVPSPLEGVDLRIAYKSPLVASQRQLEALGTVRLFEGLAQWGAVDPSVFDRFDIDRVSEVLHLGSGAPLAMVRTDREVQQAREARAQQQQVQQAAQVAQQAAPAIQALRPGQ